jgi:hypothetical protein
MSSPEKKATTVSLSERLRVKEEGRKRQKRTRAQIDASEWRLIPQERAHFELEFVAHNDRHAFVVFDDQVKKIDIFTKIVDETVIDEVIDHSSGMCYPNGSRIRVTQKMAYQLLAVFCRVQALHKEPQEGRKNGRALRISMCEARNHFQRKYPNSQNLGINVLETSTANFFFPIELEPTLSERFQSCLHTLGEFIAGDEKLLHFTGSSGFVRKVPNKPDKLGIWHYELAVSLSDGSPFLIYTRTHDSDHSVGVKVPTAEVIEEWAKIIVDSSSFHTILVADSYYLDLAGLQYLRDNNVKFVCGVQKNRFADLAAATSSAVTSSGMSAVLANTNASEVFVDCWDKNTSIGRKFVLTNAFSHKKKRGKPHVLVGYDAYKIAFSLCDHFNRELHDRTWPHKHGGRNSSGDRGAISDFLFSIVLVNVLSAYHCARGTTYEPSEYQDECLKLANEIWEYSSTL